MCQQADVWVREVKLKHNPNLKIHLWFFGVFENDNLGNRRKKLKLLKRESHQTKKMIPFILSIIKRNGMVIPLPIETMADWNS